MKCKNCEYQDSVTSMGYCRQCCFPAMRMRVSLGNDDSWENKMYHLRVLSWLGYWIKESHYLLYGHPTNK